MEPAEGRRINKLGGLFLGSEKAISHIWLGACLTESGDGDPGADQGNGFPPIVLGQMAWSGRQTQKAGPA